MLQEIHNSLRFVIFAKCLGVNLTVWKNWMFGNIHILAVATTSTSIGSWPFTWILGAVFDFT